MALIANALDREGSGRRDRRGLLEREAGRLRLEPGRRNGCVLGEGTPVTPQVGGEALPEDLVAGPEARHVPADRLHLACQIRARNEVLRSAHPRAHEPEDVGNASHHVPDVGVDRRRVNVNQDLIVLGVRPFDIAELENIRRAVPVLDDRLHRAPHTVTTIFPRACPSSRYRIASGASIRG